MNISTPRGLASLKAAARNVDQKPLIPGRASSLLSWRAMAVAGFNVLRALATRKYLGKGNNRSCVVKSMTANKAFY